MKGATSAYSPRLEPRRSPASLALLFCHTPSFSCLVDSAPKDLKPSHSPPCPLPLPYSASLGNESAPTSSHPQHSCQDGSYQAYKTFHPNHHEFHPSLSTLLSQGFENGINTLGIASSKPGKQVLGRTCLMQKRKRRKPHIHMGALGSQRLFDMIINGIDWAYFTFSGNTAYSSLCIFFPLPHTYSFSFHLSPVTFFPLGSFNMSHIFL